MESKVRISQRRKKAQTVALAPTSGGSLPTAKTFKEVVKFVRTGKNQIDHIQMVRQGLPLAYVDVIADGMCISKTQLFHILNLPTATMNRKRAKGDKLSPEQSERVLGVLQLVDTVDRIVRESGDPKGFDAKVWVKNWLNQPTKALGGQRPGDLMDTMAGQAVVLELVTRMQSGAYS